MVRSREAVPAGRPPKSGMRSGRGAVALAAAAGLVVTFGVPASASAASLRARDVQRAHASSSSTFVVGDTSSVQKLDPDVVTNFLDFQALGLIYDQLVQYNNKLQLVPDLATSWSYSDGNRLLTFQLRKGVTFDDGSSFTSANVVASLDRALAPKTGDASASFLANVKKIVPTGTYSGAVPAQPAGHLDPRRADFGQPFHAVDQGHHRRHPGQDARRDGAVRVLELEPRQYVRHEGQPRLLGRQGNARLGEDRDHPVRAVHRLRRRGQHRPDSGF